MNKYVCKTCVNRHQHRGWGVRDEWRWHFYEEVRCMAWSMFDDDGWILFGTLPKLCPYQVEHIVLGQKFSWKRWLAKILI